MVKAGQLFCVLGILLSSGCGKSDPPAPKPAQRPSPKKPAKIVVPDLSAEQNDKARILSMSVCAQCHLRPEPGMLDRRAWVEVMDHMKPWLGLEPVPKETPGHLRGLYPTNAVVSQAQWQLLRDFYVFNSKEKLASRPLPFDGEAKIFEEVDAKAPFGAFLLSARVEPGTGAVWVGLSRTAEVVVCRRASDGQWSDRIDWVGGTSDFHFGTDDPRPSRSGPSDFHFGTDGIYVLMMGNRFPHDRADGRLMKVVDGNATEIAGKLRRPTDVLAEDFNGDRKLDLVICEYGNLAGGIVWLESTKGGKRKMLLEQPGILNAAAADFNGDGQLDFAALIGQAGEMVMLFLGDGKGGFEPRALLPRHPGWGHSHLEVADFNGDAHPDLLITNGDNGDLRDTPIRPYHGIRIHLNDGKGHFNQEKFFPQPGAYRALARDFDGDGDLDIVSLSFFADYINDPESALIYLRQDTPMKFSRLKLPGAQKGRWITMDAGDIDQDGDEDVVIAALNLGPGTKYIPTKTRRRWGRQEIPVLILRNRTK